MAASRPAFAAPLWAVVTRPAATPATSVAQRGWGAPVRRPPRWAAARLGVRRASSRRGAVVVAVAPPPPSPPSAEEGGVSSAAAAPPPLSSDAEAADALVDMDGAPSAEAFAHALAFLPARRAVTVVALLGALETAFLTATKAFSSPAAICGTRGCVDVLSGPYASFLGIPLSLFGFVSYAAFAALAGWPLASPTTSPDFVRRDAATRPLMVGLSAAMVVFSAYLVSLLAFVIRSPCVYCLTSASLCAALFVLTTLVGRAVASVGATVRIGGVGGVAAALLSGVVFLTAPVKAAPPSAPPAITAVSDRKAMVRFRGVCPLEGGVKGWAGG